MRWHQIAGYGRLGLRQLWSDRPAGALLVMVIFVGSFLGATAPMWVESRMDGALRQSAEEAGRQVDLTRSDIVEAAPTTEVITGEFDRLGESEPTVARHYADDRWAVTTSPVRVLNVVRGDHAESVAFHVDLHMSELIEQAKLAGGQLPRHEIEWRGSTPVVDVVAVPLVARELGLDIDDEVVMNIPVGPDANEPDGDDQLAYVVLRLAGLVEPVDPGEDRWRDVPAVLDTSLLAPDGAGDPAIPYGTLLAAPDVAAELSGHVDHTMRAQWWATLQPATLRAQHLDELVPAVRRVENETSWQTSLDGVLGRYVAAHKSAEALAAFMVVSFTGMLMALLLLAVAVLAGRRADALRLARVRGGRIGQLLVVLCAEAAACAIPATSLGVIVAVLVAPGEPGPLIWVVPAIMLALSLVALPAAGMHVAERSAMSDRPEHSAVRPPTWRLALEGGAILLALVTLGLLSQRDAPGDTVDPVLSAAPLIVAAAAGLATFRVLPFAVAGIVGRAGRLRGATAFVAIARLARGHGYSALALVAVLAAVGVAAFGTSMTSTAAAAQESASWKAVGADAVVTPTPAPPDGQADSQEDIRDLVPSATAVAVGHDLPVESIRRPPETRSLDIDVIAIDASAWASVIRHAPDPAESVATLAAASETATGVPFVLVGQPSPAIARDGLDLDLGGAEIRLELIGHEGSVPGVVSRRSAVVPAAALPDGIELGKPSVVFLAGDVSRDELEHAFPDAELLLRADVLADLHDDALLKATTDIVRTTSVTAAVLAGAAAVLGLLATGRSRAYSMSVLRTLGLTARQSTALLAMEVLPSMIAAAAVGGFVGLGLMLVSSGSIDYARLSSGVDAQESVTLDYPGAALAAGAVLAVAVAIVVITIALSRRARLGAVLRVGGSS